jgi:hypothetical protein
MPRRPGDRLDGQMQLGGQVQLGGPAAAGATESVVIRLDGDPAGRLLLQILPFPRSGGVLVCPADCGTEVEVAA